MARDDREVEAAVPSGGRRIRLPERRGSRAGVRRLGGGRVRRPGTGQIRCPTVRSGRFRRLGCGSTPPDLVEAGSGGVGGGGVQQSMGEALATGTRIHVP
uniref:Uncharacterized protein n=1 Tax=Oryza sativa subsp. japonica TaxID=39947 RepID=Q6Z5Y8_ORYSJ|nr:hypothetical protein [Oryza sativa Japonica Group]